MQLWFIASPLPGHVCKRIRIWVCASISMSMSMSPLWASRYGIAKLSQRPLDIGSFSFSSCFCFYSCSSHSFSNIVQLQHKRLVLLLLLLLLLFVCLVLQMMRCTWHWMPNKLKSSSSYAWPNRWGFLSLSIFRLRPQILGQILALGCNQLCMCVSCVLISSCQDYLKIKVRFWRNIG